VRLAAASVALALIAIGCAHAPERLVLDQFFVASRLRDRTALARFSIVVFEPRTDGMVTEFVVAGVTPERRLSEDQTSSDGNGLEGERRLIASLSLADPTDPVDLTQAQIVLWEKNVTISARVRGGDGTAATRSIVVTLQCARIANNRARSGRWIVVRFVG
jgi:hypothetical protein